MTYAYTGNGVLISESPSSTTTHYTQDLAAPLSQLLQTHLGASAWASYLYGHKRLATLALPRCWYLTNALDTCVARSATQAPSRVRDL